MTEQEQNEALLLRPHRAFLVLEFAKALASRVGDWNHEQLLNRAETITDEYLKRFPPTH